MFTHSTLHPENAVEEVEISTGNAAKMVPSLILVSPPPLGT